MTTFSRYSTGNRIITGSPAAQKARRLKIETLAQCALANGGDPEIIARNIWNRFGCPASVTKRGTLLLGFDPCFAEIKLADFMPSRPAK